MGKLNSLTPRKRGKQSSRSVLSNSRRLTKLHRDRKRNIISGGHRCAWNINSGRIHIVLIPPPSIMHVSPLPRRYHTWIGDRFRLGGLHPRQAYPLTSSSSRKSNLDQEWPRRNETCTLESNEVIQRHRATHVSVSSFSFTMPIPSSTQIDHKIGELLEDWPLDFHVIDDPRAHSASRRAV